MSRATALVLFFLQLQLLAVALAQKPAAAAAGDDDPSKVGAGFLFCSGGKVYLMHRNSKNNNNTWHIPGGNAEPTDKDLLASATREAGEELGTKNIPPHKVKGQILTKRGKQNEKHFTVFVAEVAPTATNIKPTFDIQSTEARWTPWSEVLAAAAGRNPKLPLHPILNKLAKDHASDVRRLSTVCTGTAATAPAAAASGSKAGGR